jgi:hypothetical protein
MKLGLRRISQLTRWIVVCFAVSGVITTADAQGPTQVSWNEITVNSAKLGGPRSIIVVTPPSYDGITPMPVLVLLDADDRPQFEAAVANQRFLAGRSSLEFPTVPRAR